MVQQIVSGATFGGDSSRSASAALAPYGVHFGPSL